MQLTKVIGASLVLFLAACAASVPPGVGAWDVQMNTPLGNQDAVLTIAEDGTGTMAGQQGEQAISGIVMDGNEISFSVDIDAQGQSLTLEFSGAVDGDSLSGEFQTPFGALAVNGSRR